jgi:hypothetical protein
VIVIANALVLVSMKRLLRQAKRLVLAEGNAVSTLTVLGYEAADRLPDVAGGAVGGVKLPV